FFQAEDGIRDLTVTGVQTCALPIWIPTEALRGELAEKWEWKQNPLQLIITLRKGVMFPEKAGVMKSRELVADDVIYAFKRLSTRSEERRVGKECRSRWWPDEQMRQG